MRFYHHCCRGVVNIPAKPLKFYGNQIVFGKYMMKKTHFTSVSVTDLILIIMNLKFERKKFIENSKVGKSTLRVLIPASKPIIMSLWTSVSSRMLRLVPIRKKYVWTTYISNIQQHSSHKKSPSLQKFAFIFVDSLFP